MGFSGDGQKEFEHVEQEIRAELARSFRPEFLNRVDETIVFNPLGIDDLRCIIDILLDEVNLTLAERGLSVEIDSDAKSWLLDKAGVDPSTGARPLRRALQRHVQDQVSEILLASPESDISRIRVSVEDGELRLVSADAAESVAGPS